MVEGNNGVLRQGTHLQIQSQAHEINDSTVSLIK